MYSPKIKEEHVKALYQLKLIEKKPMTVLVFEAIQNYLNLKSNKMENNNEQSK